MKIPIYFDYAATTPVDPRVVTKMQQCLSIEGLFGNPTSTHSFGQAAREIIEKARAEVAAFIHAESSEIIWTSGATESINLALLGAAQLYQQKGKHIITVKTEHPAVLDTCLHLEKNGFHVTYLTPEKNGLLNLDKLALAIREDTILVSVMHVNNEIGVIQDLHAIGKLTSARQILFHVDATQSVGKIEIDVNTMHIDLMSFSAHKIYGPKGIGALYVRKKPRVRVAPQLFGGGQEQGMRSGTLATHQIAGMGEAFTIAKNELHQDRIKLTALRELFLQAISPHKTITVNGDLTHSVPGIINIRVQGISAQQLMQSLPDIAISSGSACGTKGGEPSHVLRALGLTREEAECSIRISFGRFTTEEEVESFITALISHSR